MPIHRPGAFAFYTTYAPLPAFWVESAPASPITKTDLYYIDVCPRLTVNDELLPLDALSICSVLSKCMGKYPGDWSKHLEGLGQTGYNMIHFVPLMQRGESNSPYSIFDQFQFDSDFFPNGEADVAEMVKRMETQDGLLALTDVVWNHTANNSAWLQEHPEAGYNLRTAPWLQAAVELEDALFRFSRELGQLGLPEDPQTPEDLQQIINGVKIKLIPSIRLWEFYVVDVKRDASEAVEAWKAGQAMPRASPLEGLPLEEKLVYLREEALLGQDRMGERYRRRIDPRAGAALIVGMFGQYGRMKQDVEEKTVLDEFTAVLNVLNVDYYKEYDADSAIILEQLSGRVRYLHLDHDGPKLGPITAEQPLIEPYFTRLPINATTEKYDPGCRALANNGWVWNADALKDNAGPASKAYLRRELIVWGDCVKLRYGTTYDDNPFLWERMASYTRLMAKHFAGFRIDNCHSTPITVAEYMLDEARKVRPNLYVCGELFTGSETMDYIFVKRLGISSLIREAMKAWNTQELSRVVHMHGGRPIGSFDVDRTAGIDAFTPANGSPDHPSQETFLRIKRTPVHALFMDCTHDNPVPAQERQARDTLPNAGLVYMCACATGSVLGYDDVFPRLINLVSETRTYMLPDLDPDHVNSTGIRKVKKLLNDVHTLMGKDGYDETFVHQEGEYITVHRMHPKTRKGYFLIAHTSFPGSRNDSGSLGPSRLDGTQVELLGSWSLTVDDSDEAKSKVIKDPQTLRGLPCQLVKNKGVTMETKDGATTISITKDFPPGSIALFKTRIPHAEHAEDLDAYVTSGASEAFQPVNLIDLNFVLYRCEPEERDASDGRNGDYHIPNYGPLVYAGLQGWWSVLRHIIRTNDLAHPLCQHLRSGQWPLDYILQRMERLSDEWCGGRLLQPTQWLRDRFDLIRQLPASLLPRYFALVVQSAYNAAFNRGVRLMTKEIQRSPQFVQKLAMVSVQQTGCVKSASLYPSETVPCMAAGLPHFATDWARCWGRDVFISLRGLYLCTGRYNDAKAHILAFASVLKHGMIPNLLSSGKMPRYNSRDSIWFFLQSIQDYTKMVPEGINILQEKVSRRFLPYDDSWFPFDDPKAYRVSSTIEDVIQEALQRHATPLSFREANAGPQLDMQMKPEGFQIDINVNWTTGFIFGGSQDNCGTWQDKMGESERAGSKGVPGTPRDGAAIEIIGLLYSTLRWLAQLHEQGQYKYSGVRPTVDHKSPITFKQWSSLIEDNFERCYYVPTDAAQDDWYQVHIDLVQRRGIYKDLYRSGKEREDYQLRSNFPIAMCVAPQLFDPDKALHALAIADKILRGPLGMATLEPCDRDYRPFYNNSEDSTDFATSKGRNYHQGPEWIWPTGYFLRALLYFELQRRKNKHERIETLQQITKRLKGCKQAMESSPWAGLPELTNKDGAFCADSVSAT